MDIDMGNSQYEHVACEHHGADNEVRRTIPNKKIDRQIIGENDRHTIIVIQMCLNIRGNIDGDNELSDISLSADVCARYLQRNDRSQDVRMTRVHFCDTVQTNDIIAYCEIYDQPLKKFVLGKHSTYMNISPRACAYTGLRRDELMVGRLKMAKSGRWKKSSPKTDCLGDRQWKGQIRSLSNLSGRPQQSNSIVAPCFSSSLRDTY